MQRNPHRGFTLLEILIVLVVLIFMAAILFPIFFRAREPNHRRSCQSNLKQVALGLFQYTQDYNENFPPIGKVSAKGDSGWARELQPYVKSLQILVCPQDIFSSDAGMQSVRYTNYYINRNLSQKNQAKVNTPAATIMTGDGEVASSNYACANLDFCTGLSEEGAVGAVPSNARTRHMNGSNYGFADGHVKWCKPERISARPGKDVDYSFALR